ncbi:hypothetical protein Tco_0828669 [Tanacetum coccineum]
MSLSFDSQTALTDCRCYTLVVVSSSCFPSVEDSSSLLLFRFVLLLEILSKESAKVLFRILIPYDGVFWIHVSSQNTDSYWRSNWFGDLFTFVSGRSALGRVMCRKKCERICTSGIISQNAFHVQLNGRMFSDASTAAMSTFVRHFGPHKDALPQIFPPFDLVSRYRRKRECHEEIFPGPEASVGRSFEQLHDIVVHLAIVAGMC